MATITTKKENKSLKLIREELSEIKNYLRKLLIIIPEESLKEYKNSSQIKKALQNAIKNFPGK